MIWHGKGEAVLRDQGGHKAVQRNRYLLVSLPRALIHKIILSVGERGLLQPSSERAIESVMPDVPILEKVERFGLLVQLSVLSW